MILSDKTIREKSVTFINIVAFIWALVLSAMSFGLSYFYSTVDWGADQSNEGVFYDAMIVLASCVFLWLCLVAYNISVLIKRKHIPSLTILSIFYTLSILLVLVFFQQVQNALMPFAPDVTTLVSTFHILTVILYVMAYASVVFMVIGIAVSIVLKRKKNL